MRGKDAIAVGSRHPDGTIVWQSEPLDSILHRNRFARAPFFRGLVVLYETLGPTLGPGADAAAILWGAAHTCAMTYPESVRRAGFEGEGPALGEALFEALLSRRSGVSVRVSVANLEVLIASALKRAVRLGESSAAPRVSDLGALLPATTGKIELETLGDESPEDRVVDRLLTRALYNVFSRTIDMDDLEELSESFESGLVIETGELVPSREYVRWMRETPGLDQAVARLVGDASPAVVASAVEFLLEGMHLHRRLNKERGLLGGGGRYRA